MSRKPSFGWKRLRKWFPKMLALLMGSVLALALAEALLWILPAGAALHRWNELVQFRETQLKPGDSFIIDEEIGFRPVPGGQYHPLFGTKANSYPAQKRPSVARILFIGDSVTARGRIISALKARLGEDGCEYWNAGVESYNTRQEVEFFRSFNRLIEPDHVILTFHLNDYQVTPAAFVDDKGVLTVYAPGRRLTPRDRTLARRFAIYRYWLSWSWFGSESFEESSRSVRLALDDLKGLASIRSRLSVIVFPILRPLQQWRERDRRALADIRDYLDSSGIPSYDLTPFVLAELKAGRSDLHEFEGDDWHPSQALADRIAVFLQGEGLLASECRR